MAAPHTLKLSTAVVPNQICQKRGILGKCTKTEARTLANDNDKASKYFRDPEERMKEKYSAKQLQTETETVDSGDGSTRVIASSEGNELIEKLRQASLDNKEKNDKIIRMKTLTNDLVSVYRFNSIQLLEFKYGS